MVDSGPTVRPPHAATAAYPLPEESATAPGADRHRLRRRSCRVRHGDLFLARIAQSSSRAYVPAQLLSAARANPSHVFRVILQGAGARGETRVVSAVRARGVSVDRRLGTVSGASAAVTGRQLLQLSAAKGVAAITLDRPVHLLDEGDDGSGFSSTQQWPYAVKAQKDWNKVSNGKLPTPPAIAIVDSGIQANRADFDNGASVLTQVTMVNTGTPNSPGDGYGHGTFVAGIAAGSAQDYAGTSPTAPLVSLDVLDDQGMGLTSDVIAACDWIVKHKAKYNIQVANFSLQSAAPASVFWDPLDKAVERLWFDGITVVAASGNYGTGDTPSGVLYAPGNDPFVITVGADDIGGTNGTRNDVGGPVLGLGLHVRRLRQARALGARPLHGRPGPRQLDARDDPARRHGRSRLRAAFGHLVRGAGRLGRGRVPARSAPEVDAGPGQGRAHGLGEARAERDARLGRRRPGEPRQRDAARRPAAERRTRLSTSSSSRAVPAPARSRSSTRRPGRRRR